MHPKSNIERIYILKIKNKLTESILKKLTNGIILDKNQDLTKYLYTMLIMRQNILVSVSCTEEDIIL